MKYFLAGVAHLVILINDQSPLMESSTAAISNFIKRVRVIFSKMKRHVGTLWTRHTQQGFFSRTESERF